MEITKVKTAIKVANIVIRDDSSKNKIKMQWENLGTDILKDNSGRVYLIVVDGEIYKIGYSQSKHGIKGTWYPYCGAMSGAPSVRTYGIHILIREQLNLGKKVELYMIVSKKIKVMVSGLFDSTELEVSASKEMERLCLEEYVIIENQFPIWNFQESNRPWPKYIQDACNLLNMSTIKKSKRNT
jgi:hypothetical protein